MLEDRIHPDCRAFVHTVETLLKRRQTDLLAEPVWSRSWQRDAWGPRTWTRTELEDMVYSSYKRMRQGHITRPPRREVVMEIADYLNCTLEERNRLLIAAHGAPVAPYFTGDKLLELLQAAIGVAQTLTVPALIINRDWSIHYLNERLLHSYAITPEQLDQIPADKRNLLRLMYDPQLPLYARLIDNRPSWLRMARQTMYGFKMANLLCQVERWYVDLVDELMLLPDFNAHWNNVSTDVPFGYDPSARALPLPVTVETRLLPTEQRQWIRPLVISVGYFQFDFPQILAFMPVDEANTTPQAELFKRVDR